MGRRHGVRGVGEWGGVDDVSRLATVTSRKGLAVTNAVDMYGYVAPAVELLYENGTPEFRSQWPRIEQQLDLVRPRPGTGDWSAPYLCVRSLAEVSEPGARRTELDPVPVPRQPQEGAGIPDRILHDNPAARVDALMAAGVELQVVSPGPSLDACLELGSALAVGMFGAYNQFALAYCRRSGGHLKAAIQVHGAEPHWTAREIRDLANAPEVAGVTVHLPVRIAPDDRNFVPIWQALEDTRLPLLHRPSSSARVWSADRLLTYLVHSGLIERHQGLRIAFLESSGADWLPAVLARRGQRSRDIVVSLLASGRVGAAVNSCDDPHALGPVTSEVGTACLVWQSQFPFGENVDGAPALVEAPAGVPMATLGANARSCLRRDDVVPAVAA